MQSELYLLDNGEFCSIRLYIFCDVYMTQTHFLVLSFLVYYVQCVIIFASIVVLRHFICLHKMHLMHSISIFVKSYISKTKLLEDGMFNVFLHFIFYPVSHFGFTLNRLGIQSWITGFNR